MLLESSTLSDHVSAAKPSQATPIAHNRNKRQSVPLAHSTTLKSAWTDGPAEVLEAAKKRYDVVLQVIKPGRTSKKIGSQKAWHHLHNKTQDLRDSRLGSRTSYQNPMRTRSGAFCSRATVMHPVGAPRFIWNGFSLLLISWVLFIIPLQVFDLPDESALVALEWL